MASLNKVCLIGYLGQAPNTQYSRDGKAFCSLSIATDESYSSKDGQRIDRTQWHKVNVFGRQAENCGQYLKKGSLVYVEGSLGTRKWQDKDGNDRYSTEVTARIVTFLDRQSNNFEQYRPSHPFTQPPQKNTHTVSDFDAAFGPAPVSDVDAAYGPVTNGKAAMDEVPF